MENFRLAGVMASVPDQRDYIFVPRTISFPRRFTAEQHVVEWEDQGKQGACVGNGTCSSLETFTNEAGGGTIDLSRQYVYDKGRFLENRLGQSGMHVRTAMKVVQKFGVPFEADYPYSMEESPGQDPGTEIDALAAQHKVDRYEFVFPGSSVYGAFEREQKVDRVKAALLEGFRPVIAFCVTNTIFSMRGPRHTHQYQYADENNPAVGGHLMYVVGYDDDLGGFLIANSWGQSWGDYGLGLFPYAVVDELFAESWIMRGFNGLTIPEQPGIKLEYANKFTVGFRIVPEPHEIGQRVKVWIGAKTPDGRIFMNHSLAFDDFKYRANSYFPEAGSILLEQDNPVKAVHWRDMQQLGGVTLYAAYGTSPLDWKLQKLVTL